MSNENKDALLGINFSTATQRLRKLILFRLVQLQMMDQCFRCGNRIEDVDDLSIEHKAPWQSAPDPKVSFFDLENIAFSHLRCNIGAPRKLPVEERKRRKQKRNRSYQQSHKPGLRDYVRRYRQNKKDGRAAESARLLSG